MGSLKGCTPRQRRMYFLKERARKVLGGIVVFVLGATATACIIVLWKCFLWSALMK